MARIPSDASDARRGKKIRTVTEFPFECNAGESKVTGKSFLANVRSLSEKLRIEENVEDFEQLQRLIKEHISKSNMKFEELCEAFLSLLYFSLVYPEFGRKNIEGLFYLFLEKWFGEVVFDLGILLISIEEKYRIPIFGSNILLYNHKFTSTNTRFCQILQWHSSNLLAPKWIQEALSCTENTYENLNKILYKNLNFFNCTVEINFERPYFDALSTFLDACNDYRGSHFDDSIAKLDSLNNVNCGQFLIGWKELMIGLNLEHLNKYNSAIIKYKEAANKCSELHYAMYYSSRIFQKMGSVDAAIECLRLLTLVNSQNFIIDSSLQKTLICYHLPVALNLSTRSNYLLASAYLLNKRWLQAQELFSYLLKNWYSIAVPRSYNKKGLLMPCDELPDLPPVNCVRLGSLMVFMSLKRYEEMEFNQPIDIDLSYNNFEEFGREEMMSTVAIIICHLIHSESLYKQGQLEPALSKCGRLLIPTESLHASTGPWKALVILMKAYLYKMLSVLYLQNPMMLKNSSHFARLQDHCLKIFKECEEKEGGLLDIFINTCFLVLKSQLELA